MAMMTVRCKFCGKLNTKRIEDRTCKCRCGKTTIYAVVI